MVEKSTRPAASRSALPRFLQWSSAALWGGSWTIILLEIIRWHHMNWKLQFTPPQPPPGFQGQAHAGLPVITACVCACSAPAIFLGATVWARHRQGIDRASTDRSGVIAGRFTDCRWVSVGLVQSGQRGYGA